MAGGGEGSRPAPCPWGRQRTHIHPLCSGTACSLTPAGDPAHGPQKVGSGVLAWSRRMQAKPLRQAPTGEGTWNPARGQATWPGRHVSGADGHLTVPPLTTRWIRLPTGRRRASPQTPQSGASTGILNEPPAGFGEQPGARALKIEPSGAFFRA